LGTVLGLALSAFAPAKLLTRLFAGIAVGERLAFTGTPLKELLGQLSPAIVGALASAVGVGGRTLSTPVLSLFSLPIKQAIGAGALFNQVIALPAAAFFLTHDHGTPDRCAGRRGAVLRGGAVAACALCRAHGGALVARARSRCR
jgi:uncharacterized membrane protein YfcA